MVENPRKVEFQRLRKEREQAEEQKQQKRQRETEFLESQKPWTRGGKTKSREERAFYPNRAFEVGGTNVSGPIHSKNKPRRKDISVTAQERAEVFKTVVKLVETYNELYNGYVKLDENLVIVSTNTDKNTKDTKENTENIEDIDSRLTRLEASFKTKMDLETLKFAEKGRKLQAREEKRRDKNKAESEEE